MKQLLQLPYSHVLVLGLAKSGSAAANILLDSGIKVRINDKATEETDPSVEAFKKRGAEVVLGSHPVSVLDQVELVVKNPGIPYNHEIIQLAMQKDIPIITEVELAYELAKNHEIIGITGSNGKTTTTMLCYEMLKGAQGRGVKLAGNIGMVASEVARTLEKDDRFLLELSSFQLQGTNRFHPHIACLLNLYDAHLDYHETVAGYEAAKSAIFRQQTASDYLVYNKDQEKVRRLVSQSQANLLPFSTRERLTREGAWTDGEWLYFKEEALIRIDEAGLVGEHNHENMLAAIAIAKLCQIEQAHIVKVLKNFTGVKHRLQFIAKVNGRKFYNDSKATNILATQKALQSFSSPTILLAGGLDRQEDFDKLLPYLKHVKALISFGETKEKLATLAKKAKIEFIYQVDDVAEATELAYQISEVADTILLSPACASWDQYKTFEERGDMFIQTVHTLL